MIALHFLAFGHLLVASSSHLRIRWPVPGDVTNRLIPPHLVRKAKPFQNQVQAHIFGRESSCWEWFWTNGSSGRNRRIIYSRCRCPESHARIGRDKEDGQRVLVCCEWMLCVCNLTMNRGCLSRMDVFDIKSWTTWFGGCSCTRKCKFVGGGGWCVCVCVSVYVCFAEWLTEAQLVCFLCGGQ